MSKGVNKVIIIGNLGQEPEIKQVGSNLTVTTLSIATSESWKDKASGEKQEKTEWHRVVLFNKLAEIAGEYLRKGSKVYIEGKLETKKWTDKQGIERYTTQIQAANLQMLDGRSAGQVGSSQSDDMKPMYHDYAAAPAREHPAPLTDDDIPF